MQRYQIHIWKDVETKEEADQLNERIKVFLENYPDLKYHAGYSNSYEPGPD